MRFERWVSTVDNPRSSSVATSLFDRPSARRCRTSFSRSVSRWYESVRAALLQGPHVVFNEDRGDGRTEEWLAGSDGTNGGQEVLVGGVLQQVGARAGGEGADDIGLVGVHAQDDHGWRRIELLRAGGHLDATQLRHADIDNEQVGSMLFAQARGFDTIGGFTDDGMARVFQQTPQPPSHDTVIVSQQHAQAGPPSSGPAWGHAWRSSSRDRQHW